MRTILIAVAAVLAAASAVASEQTDVIAPVQQFIDATNKGDTKAALATCADPTSILDEFPPHAWQGATACSDWVKDFEAYNKQNGITEPIATLGKPTHVDNTGDRAYVVIPASFTFKQNGKQVTESGSIMAAALHKGATGWRMTAWSWAKH